MTAQHQFLQIISLLMDFALIHLGQFQRIHRPKLAAVEPPAGAGSDALDGKVHLTNFSELISHILIIPSLEPDTAVFSSRSCIRA